MAWKPIGMPGRSLTTVALLLISALPVQSEGVPKRRIALDGQCALGWVYGHRILTDCTVTWLDPHNGETFCFTTRTARERFIRTSGENIERARAHYQSATNATGGD